MEALVCAVIALVALVVALAFALAAGRGPRRGGAPRHLGPAEAFAARRRFAAAPGAGGEGPVGADTALFFNVHEYRDALGDGRREGVARLVARLAAPCVFLAEAAPAAATRAVLRGRYPYALTAENGGTLLTAAWTDPRATVVVVPAGAPGARDCILYATRTLRLLAVHLEIGERPRPDAPGADAANRRVRAANAAARTRQLAALLAHEPDALLGDFNFELGGEEDAWLRARGYVAVNDGRVRSTPFNRVDHCYVRAALAKRHPPASNRLLPVALSDHRPMLQRLEGLAP